MLSCRGWLGDPHVSPLQSLWFLDKAQSRPIVSDSQCLALLRIQPDSDGRCGSNFCLKIRETKGRFGKRAAWRMHSRSGFCTIIPFFVPSFRFLGSFVLFLYPRSSFGGPRGHPPKPPFSAISKPTRICTAPFE